MQKHSLEIIECDKRGHALSVVALTHRAAVFREFSCRMSLARARSANLDSLNYCNAGQESSICRKVPLMHDLRCKQLTVSLFFPHVGCAHEPVPDNGAITACDFRMEAQVDSCHSSFTLRFGALESSDCR